MKKNIFILLMVFITVIVVSCSKNRVEYYAKISFIVGDVKKNGVNAQIGDIIKQDDIIKTAVNSFCDIKIGKSFIRVKEKTNVSITTLTQKEGIDHITFDVNIGKIVCKIKKLLKSERFIVKTPKAIASVMGTQFTVKSDRLNTTRIKVFNGEVKAAKRIRQFESHIEKVMSISPSVKKHEKVIITANDIKEAEKIVTQALAEEGAKDTPSDKLIEETIKNTWKQVKIQDKNIEKFAASDFIKENREIIEIQEKPKEIIAAIVKTIQQTIDVPKPEGRLLVTKYDVYFIKQGKIRWEEKLVEAPIQDKDKLYIASGDFVFCASLKGPVLWKQNIKNDGKLSLKEGKIILKAQGKDIPLDPMTGNKL